MILPPSTIRLVSIGLESTFAIATIGSVIHLVRRMGTHPTEKKPSNPWVLRLSILSMILYFLAIVDATIFDSVEYASAATDPFCKVIMTASGVLVMLGKNTMYLMLIWMLQLVFQNSIFEFGKCCAKGITAWIVFNSAVLVGLQLLYWPNVIQATNGGKRCEQIGGGSDTIFLFVIALYLLSDICLSLGSSFAFLCRMKMLYVMSGQEELKLIATKVTTVTLVATISTFLTTVIAVMTDFDVAVRLDMLINCLCVYCVFRVTEDNYKRFCWCCRSCTEFCVVRLCCEMCICCWALGDGTDDILSSQTPRAPPRLNVPSKSGSSLMEMPTLELRVSNSP